MLTFAHEFGHFCNDYASQGSAVGMDVAEVFSQSMEYLSLSYGQAGEALKKGKMADSLRIFVEQAAYAMFEHLVYDLEGAELTAENIYAVYEDVGSRFGFEVWGWDSRDFVVIDHFFSAPQYIISYVVSNDAAFQIFQLEQEKAGAGLRLFEESLDTQQVSLLAFAQEAGLKSPFEPGRIQAVRKTLEEFLK
jgi:oligoendopeptidase F